MFYRPSLHAYGRSEAVCLVSASPRTNPQSGEILKRDDLYIALNATTHAIKFAQSAAKPFAADVDELEIGSRVAGSVAFIRNRLSDAQESLSAAETEMARLLHEGLIE